MEVFGSYGKVLVVGEASVRRDGGCPHVGNNWFLLAPKWDHHWPKPTSSAKVPMINFFSKSVKNTV